MDRETYVSELHARFGVARPVVVALVEGVTGQAVASTQRLIRGDENEVHQVSLTDGAVVYLRISFPDTPPGKAQLEAWAMGQARDAGVPAPEVVAVEPIESDHGGRTAMVVRAANGRQLKEVEASLSPVQRSRVMAEIGRVLGILHSIPMPGTGRPDDHGRWMDADADLRPYIADILADCQHLAAAGLSPAEVDQVVQVAEAATDTPADAPVLCHGDVSAEHVFVDPQLRVVGLIDWGLWGAGSAVSDLAGVAMNHTEADFEAIIAGYGADLPTGSALRHAICWHTIARATGAIRWLVTSGQIHELPTPTTALRNALTRIAG